MTQSNAKRETFSGRKAFIMAAIGSAVGLGNIWRFPYTTYENGGGAFIIPYLIALLTAGIPLLFLDYAIGHRHRGGAALGGILSMILGRSGGASLAKLGSLAVLGNLAYQAYQNYQKSQQNSQPNISENAFDVLNSSSHVDAGELILRTMIAAAAADGEITEDEKQTIANEAGNNPELAQWLEQEIQNPISINEIARLVGNDTALASNVYLAARLVSKDLSRKEIIFLADLAQALGLDDALVEQLEKQAGF